MPSSRYSKGVVYEVPLSGLPIPSADQLVFGEQRIDLAFLRSLNFGWGENNHRPDSG
jgi:hypothetical protein